MHKQSLLFFFRFQTLFDPSLPSPHLNSLLPQFLDPILLHIEQAHIHLLVRREHRLVHQPGLLPRSHASLQRLQILPNYAAIVRPLLSFLIQPLPRYGLIASRERPIVMPQGLHDLAQNLLIDAQLRELGDVLGIRVSFPIGEVGVELVDGSRRTGRVANSPSQQLVPDGTQHDLRPVYLRPAVRVLLHDPLDLPGELEPDVRAPGGPSPRTPHHVPAPVYVPRVGAELLKERRQILQRRAPPQTLDVERIVMAQVHRLRRNVPRDKQPRPQLGLGEAIVHAGPPVEDALSLGAQDLRLPRAARLQVLQDVAGLHRACDEVGRAQVEEDGGGALPEAPFGGEGSEHGLEAGSGGERVSQELRGGDGGGDADDPEDGAGGRREVLLVVPRVVAAVFLVLVKLYGMFHCQLRPALPAVGADAHHGPLGLQLGPEADERARGSRGTNVQARHAELLEHVRDVLRHALRVQRIVEVGDLPRRDVQPWHEAGNVQVSLVPLHPLLLGQEPAMSSSSSSPHVLGGEGRTRLPRAVRVPRLPFHDRVLRRVVREGEQPIVQPRPVRLQRKPRIALRPRGLEQ
mmetsp:Transcript_19633/g.47153  ORF Transcript_19633/g.47153 Transcript_19633/m.47153 type:complete len:575 (+) Transcript_19633:232-1956(+)